MNAYENKRLYLDLSELCGIKRYVTWQLDLLPMIWDYYSLSNFEERIFLYICMQYDNVHESNREPLKLSYTDIADIVKCTVEGVRKAISNLIRCGLIIAERKGKGRTKTQYLPNVEFIHQELKEYLNLS
jgi:hypothetical protein